MRMRGSIRIVVIRPAVSLRPNPTPQSKFERAKDPFHKNYERGAQLVVRRR